MPSQHLTNKILTNKILTNKVLTNNIVTFYALYFSSLVIIVLNLLLKWHSMAVVAAVCLKTCCRTLK